MLAWRKSWGGLALAAALTGVCPNSTLADELPASLLADTTDLANFELTPDEDIWQPVSSHSGGPIWVSGVETTFLAPIMSGTTNRTLIIDNSSLDGVEVIDDIGLEMMTFAPRVWLGVQGDNGWGVVGRFWYLNDTQHASDSIDLGTGSYAFEGENRLKQYTIDFEVTRSFEWGRWMMDGSCGVRYASIDYNASLSEAAVLTSSLIGASAESDRAFHGTGVTFALGGRRAWRDNSSLHWVWNARGSAIFGTARYATSADTEILDGGGWSLTGDSETARFNDTLFIGEIQGGVQWEHALQTLPATAFFRVVCEYQYWGGVNNENISSGIVDASASGDAAAIASARGINLDLIGLSVGAGMTW
jgi:hypothetical protein